jgi:DNA-binding Lrp family transcriptional regulator
MSRILSRRTRFVYGTRRYRDVSLSIGHVRKQTSKTRSSERARGGRSVDAVDRAILRELVGRGRISVADLASRVNVSRANAYARLARLESDGVITGYRATIAPRAVGLEVAALVFLGIEQAEWREVRERLLEIAEVEFVGFATGTFDFVLLVRAAHTDELRDVVLERLVSIPGVKKTETVLLLDDVARGTAIPES